MGKQRKGKRRVKRSPAKGGGRRLDAAAEIRRAVAAHQAGRLDAAGAIYRRVLSAVPDHPDALHLSGVLAHQTGDPRAAVDLIRRAIRINPDKALYHCNLGAALDVLGESDAAMAAYETALERQPDHPDALNRLGTALYNRGAYAEAADACRRALARRPEFPEALNNLGAALKASGRPAEAEEAYREALALRPTYAVGWNNLGVVLREAGQAEEALACHRRALSLQPEFADAYVNLGMALVDAGRVEEGLEAYRQALTRSPDNAGAQNNLGNALKALGRMAEAEACYRRAVAVDPAFASAHNNLGTVLKERGDAAEAVVCYRKALSIRPDSAGYAYNLGNTLRDSGEKAAAVTAYRQALAADPGFADALNALVDQLQKDCDWESLETEWPRLDALTDQALAAGVRPGETPYVNLTRKPDPARNLIVARAWSADIARRVGGAGVSFNEPVPSNNGGRITLGYLSADFRNHPVTHLMRGIFRRHDRDRFRVCCYSYGKDDGSAYREGIRRDADRFVDLRGADHVAAARRIHEDGVEILVDLTGHTQDGRMEICALRPAPVQVSFLGFPGTTGAGFIDYLIADPTVVPGDHGPHYQEALIRLPRTFLPADSDQPVAVPQGGRSASGLPEEGIVFCSFNGGHKIEPVMFGTWMEILSRVEHSVLWLSGMGEVPAGNLRRAASDAGVSPDRLIFAHRVPEKADHLGRLALADLALDTRIYNGHTTTVDTLWAGVPVIALQGTHFASRVSASALSAVGLAELAVPGLDDYADLAVRLAADPEARRGLRRHLEAARRTAPLFETDRFTRHLERAFEAVWDRFLKGAAPAAIEVTPDVL